MLKSYSECLLERQINYNVSGVQGDGGCNLRIDFIKKGEKMKRKRGNEGPLKLPAVIRDVVGQDQNQLTRKSEVGNRNQYQQFSPFIAPFYLFLLSFSSAGVSLYSKLVTKVGRGGERRSAWLCLLFCHPGM